MALRDSEGFGWSTNWSDYTSYGPWIGPFYGNNPSINTGGPLGDNYMANAGYTAVGRLLPVAASAFFAGFRTQWGTVGTSKIYFRDASGNEQFHIEVSTSGQVFVYNNGTLLGSSGAGAVPLGTWCYFEVGAVIDPSAGSITLVSNGSTTVLALSGVNTKGSSSYGTVQRIDWGHSPADNSMPPVAHFYFCDNTVPAPWNTFLGDVRVSTQLPTGNDAVQFTPNGLANNWQNAAKVPPLPATDFNSDANVGDQDTFVMAPMPSNLSTVFGLHLKGICAKSDAGTRGIKLVMKSGATTSVGTNNALGTGAQQFRQLFQTDPNTGNAWAQSAVNGGKPGYQVG